MTGECQYSFGSVAAGGWGAKLFVWNCYNRVDVVAMVRDSTDSWTYTSAAWRSANNSAGNRVSFVSGLAEDSFEATYVAAFANASGSLAGIGYDSVSALSGTSAYNATAAIATCPARFATRALGYHFFQALEYTVGGTGTFYGDNGLAYFQTGLFASLRM